MKLMVQIGSVGLSVISNQLLVHSLDLVFLFWLGLLIFLH